MAKKPASRPSKRLRFPRDYSLSLVLFGVFLVLALAETVAGHHALNDDLQQHHQPPLTYRQYFGTGLCWESLSENWESEFLEMGAFVWLTSFLTQRGSPGSNDPDDPKDPDEQPLRPDSPWPARRGGWIAAIYARSLSLAFLLLFFISMLIHAITGAAEYNRDQVLHGQAAVSWPSFMGTSNFWFQSLQNWQSEFLGIGSMVLLSIWLRQKGSPESKPVNAPHAAHK